MEESIYTQLKRLKKEEEEMTVLIKQGVNFEEFGYECSFINSITVVLREKIREKITELEVKVYGSKS